jgi:hypothetical protein
LQAIISRQSAFPQLKTHAVHKEESRTESLLDYLSQDTAVEAVTMPFEGVYISYNQKILTRAFKKELSHKFLLLSSGKFPGCSRVKWYSNCFSYR